MSEVTVPEAIAALAGIYLVEHRLDGEDGAPLGPEWSVKKLVTFPVDDLDDATRHMLMRCWRALLDYAAAARKEKGE